MAQAATRSALLTFLTLLVALCAAVFAAEGSDPSAENFAIANIRTDSPRQTLQSWLTLSREAERLYENYRSHPTHDYGARLKVNADNFLYLMDLSETPSALRAEAGYRARYAILDILARVELPPIESVPDWSAFDESAPSGWRIPGTPISIAKVDGDDRVTQYLFSAATVRDAPDFYERIRNLPARTTDPDFSWTDSFPQLSGSLFPPSLIDGLPGSLRQLRFDTPVWKIVASLTAFGIFFAAVLFLYRLTRRHSPESRLLAIFARSAVPVFAIVFIWFLHAFIQEQVNVSGRFGSFTDITITLAYYVAYAWLFWLAVHASVEWIISSPRIPDDSLDANLLRLAAKLLGSAGAVVLLALSADRLGIPVLGVVAGLGFGGLAVALAVRPTLENLFGGIILYLDRPVKVGDLCSFGKRFGEIESIGIRSTKIRALDRTLISIPNAAFVDYELVNWGECDQMQIRTTLALRYETTPDQLRFLLTRLREMLYAHPRIDRDTVRVRFIGYGTSSFDVDIRVYVKTREWNDFFAVREDVFLRVNELVAESGTDFAIPSQTVYVAKDLTPDAGLRKDTERQVAAWRDDGELPFPDLASDRVDELANSLDYPPRGSVATPRDRAASRRTKEDRDDQRKVR